jgi:hypothetical protein
LADLQVAPDPSFVPEVPADDPYAYGGGYWIAKEAGAR